MGVELIHIGNTSVRLSHTLVTDEAHSQLCVGVGFNNIYKKYRLLWKKLMVQGLGFRLRISVRARVRVKYADKEHCGREQLAVRFDVTHTLLHTHSCTLAPQIGS